MDTPIFKFAMRSDLVDDHKFHPQKATEKDTGWDVRSASKSITLRPGQYAKISLGFRMFSPAGWWMELRPRSSSFVKKQLHCLYGVIDEQYEAECIFACQYIPDLSALGKDLTISFGDAIGQIIPVKRQDMKVEIISNEEYETLCEKRQGTRGAGGFGSTSK
jgi:dUTPase